MKRTVLVLILLAAAAGALISCNGPEKPEETGSVVTEAGGAGNPAADNSGGNTDKPGDNAENPGEGGLPQEETWTKDIVIQDSWTPGEPGADG
ncbi:MAG: hypothetical protein K6E83_03915, partial [Clostridium sp.]|nr:hypothetical protein [Clostridium sp.]